VGGLVQSLHVGGNRVLDPWHELGDERVDAREARPSAAVASRDDADQQPFLIVRVVVDHRTTRVVLRTEYGHNMSAKAE